MKTKRLLLAAALAIAAAGCARDATAPEPAVRGPGAVPASSSEAQKPVVPTTAEELTDDGTGNIGSGCCANR